MSSKGQFILGCCSKTIEMKLILPLFSVFAPFPPLGNDPEALQIHLCFVALICIRGQRWDLEATLVSAEWVISTSASRRDEEPGSCRRLQTEPSAGRSLTARRELLREEDLRRTGSVCPSPAHSSSTRPPTTSSDSSIYVSSFCPRRAVDQCLTLLGVTFFFPSLLLKNGFLLLLVPAGFGFYMYIPMCIYSLLYCMKKEFCSHPEGKLTHFKPWL